MKKNLLIVAITALCLSKTLAQEEGYNKNSVRPIHVSDQMYRKTITRSLDLREKQNTPLFSLNKEVSRLLIDGVLKGALQPYENDSLNNRLTVDDFNKKLETPASANIPEDTVELYLTYGEDWRNIVAAMKAEKYMPRDLYQLEIKEEITFDKQRSRLYYEIQSITLYIPSDNPKNIKMIQLPVASFSYKEVVENLLKDNPKAIWYNSQNDREHKNLADAFDLRLFSSYITKVSNPNDAYLTDIYQDQKKGIMAASWTAQEVLEYEHNLWEF
jgi:gliding motility associated protien GldN